MFHLVFLLAVVSVVVAEVYTISRRERLEKEAAAREGLPTNSKDRSFNFDSLLSADSAGVVSEVIVSF